MVCQKLFYGKIPRGTFILSLAQINHLLIANGADDIKNLTLNNSAENINLKIDEIPKLGEIIRR